MAIDLSERQRRIVEIVRSDEPITGERIAHRLGVSRAAIRADLSLLTMSGVLCARPRVGYTCAARKEPSRVFSDLFRTYRVQDCQSVPVVIGQSASCYDAIVTMFLEDVGTIFAVRDGRQLAGVVSRKDLLKVAIGRSDLHSVPVSLVMTRMPNIVTVQASATMYDAAKLLIDAQVDSLPVVVSNEDDCEVVGRVTKTNIARLVVELGSLREV
ncbi:MAG: helix-turn-helix transcriptional regulator [Firmicutes bacterium]|nr:helix-turn-helix transcriptional regulator [Bacillota bacterium]